MKLKEALNKVDDASIDQASVSKVEEKYGIKLLPEFRKLLSISRDTTTLEDKSIFRILSLAEILDASDDMAVDFVSRGLVPVIDVGDNDYITFDFRNQTWCLFNIVDEIAFGAKDSVEDFA
jgi:hypothetical protein